MSSPVASSLVQSQILREFPRFSIVDKESSVLMRVINIFLFILTCGRHTGFLTKYITVIGNTVYVPPSWHSSHDVARAIVLRHELVHMRQCKKHGHLLFTLMYLFFPVPVFFAYYRKKFEQEAYEETLRAMVEYVGIEALTPKVRERVLAHFSSVEYVWAWPWRNSLENWYDSFVAQLAKDVSP